ncbi:oxidoreductase [Brevundimonas sp. VNH65]|uniref:oxidoreductase n=1 Tax=Brevundimonas sp. VNH65 TaxID=3400917 RepID=UPI003C03ABAD
MRYRPFSITGGAVSDLTFSLAPAILARGPEAAAELIYGALESGINAYRLECADPVLAEVAGAALASVDRKLLNVSLVLGPPDGGRGPRDFSAEGMTHAIDRVLRVSRLGWIDIALLDGPDEHELSQSSLNALKALRATQRVHCLGVMGDDPVTDVYVSTGAFDVLATPLHVNSPWQVRSRIRAARERDMAVIVHNFFPEELDTERKAAAATEGKKKGLFGLSFGGSRHRHPLQGAGGFGFLHQTPNWSAEEICLAHVLSDTAVTSALVETTDLKALAALAAVPDRQMPPGLAAQIEMARVSMANRAA